MNDAKSCGLRNSREIGWDFSGETAFELCYKGDGSLSKAIKGMLEHGCRGGKSLLSWSAVIVWEDICEHIGGNDFRGMHEVLVGFLFNATLDNSKGNADGKVVAPGVVLS